MEMSVEADRLVEAIRVFCDAGKSPVNLPESSLKRLLKWAWIFYRAEKLPVNRREASLKRLESDRSK